MITRGGARRAAAVTVALGMLATACGGTQHVSFQSRTITLPSAGAAGSAAAGGRAKPTIGGLLPAGRSGGTGSTLAGTSTGPAAATSATGASGFRGVIKLGTVLPLEGGDSDWGIPVLRTTQAFIDELNARGGVDGYQLQLVAYNACLTCQDDALTAARRLVEQDHVFALVNTYVMVVAFQSVLPYLVQKGVPLIQGGAENQGSDALSPINFVTLPPGQFYVRFLARMAAYKHLHAVGIAYLDVPSERNGIDQVAAELQRHGIRVVDRQPIAAEEDAVTNMDSVVTRFRAKGADGVVTTNPVVLVFGRLAAARQGWSAPWVGEAAWSQLVEQTCGRTCDDVVLTDTAGLSFITRSTPQMQQYIDTLHRRYPGGSLTGHTLAAWVGMQLTVQALAEAGRPDRRAFIAVLNRTANLDLGTTGPLTFSPDRHMGSTTSVLLGFRGGHYVQLTAPMRAGEGY